MRTNLKSLALVAACAAASLAASQCASPKNSRSAAAASGDTPRVGRLEPRTWTAQSTPEEIAAWARRGCGGAVVHKDDCLEGALTSVLGSAGVDKAMAALLIISRQDEDVARDGHVFAHGIGISAYRS